MKELPSLAPKRPIAFCVSGANETSHCSHDALSVGEKLGQSIASHGCIAMLGTLRGFPLWVARGAHEAGGTTIGFSPAANAMEHESVYRLSGEHVQTMIYTGFGNAGADLIMARSSDAVIFGCGRINTIHEFTVALQEGKPIGILEGEWDTDDLLRDILKLEIDRAHETIFFDHDPNRLVERLIKAVKEKQS
jgi:uncharacterized protein (TIGR00725 family)